MGTLVRLANATAVDIMEGIKKSKQVTAIDGSSNTFNSGYLTYSSLAVRDANWGTSHSEAGWDYLFPYASSDSSIPYQQTAITNQIGTCVVVNALNADNTGWIANITITGSADAMVNSILLTRKFYVTGGGSKELLVCAYILDTPIELNADNNYTATLTLSVTFE